MCYFGAGNRQQKKPMQHYNRKPNTPPAEQLASANGTPAYFVAYQITGVSRPLYLTPDLEWDYWLYKGRVLRTSEDLAWAEEHFKAQGLPLSLVEADEKPPYTPPVFLGWVDD